MDENLFGDLFDMPKMRTPKDILNEFKKYIENESKGSVSAEIRDLDTKNQNIFAINFAIKSQKTNYSYNIFSVHHDVLMYPCIINTEHLIYEESSMVDKVQFYPISDVNVYGVLVQSEEKLREIIKIFFKTSRARTIVRAVFSQQ